jgi:hypothetical protein
MARLGHRSLAVQKMDIEGREYDVIQDILKSGIIPRQLLMPLRTGSASSGPRKACPFSAMRMVKSE